MAKKKYKVDILSHASIERLKKELNNYQKELETKTYLLCNKLADIGVQVAQANVVSLDAVFTGELFNSIKSELVSSNKYRTVFLVKATSSHAIYVEIGTGIVGAETPYPGLLPVVYAQGKTIRQLADGRYGWFYERGGQWYFTEGMPSRPFMYLASVEIQERIIQIAKDVFA